jgi:hypothetical protein
MSLFNLRLSFPEIVVTSPRPVPAPQREKRGTLMRLSRLRLGALPPPRNMSQYFEHESSRLPGPSSCRRTGRVRNAPGVWESRPLGSVCGPGATG